MPSIGKLELAVLLSVSRLADTAYGANVRRDVSARLNRRYSVGAIYTTLQRLEDKGLLRSTSGEPTAIRGGRSRRFFRVTAAGARAVQNARGETAAVWAGVKLRSSGA